MPKIAYIQKRFTPERMEKIRQANEIIDEYQSQGYELTLRQIYYQFVARGIIPNNLREYKNLGEVLNDARLAGLVDWLAMVDRTRNLRAMSHWDTPAEIIKSAASSYHIDHWAEQDYRPEVWIEKDALVGVIERVCDENDVPYFSCRGYTSQSELWMAGRRLGRHVSNGQTPLVIHFGDHDPSGIDMTRDILERLAIFAGGHIEVRRLALNMPQIDEFNPPPNPCKLTDSRATGYIQKFGNESWELDALDPKVIHELIENEIQSVRDESEWTRSHRRQQQEKSKLEKLSAQWEKISKTIK